MHTVAIIGAGFSGSLVAVHLLRGASSALRVVLIDRSGAFGPGLAYGNGSDSLLLNVVAGRMSALADEPSDFLRWARGIDPTIRGEMFLPRRLYGRYLADLLARTERECVARAELARLEDEAVDLCPTDRGVAVGGRSASEICADVVVLAPGNFRPAVPAWGAPLRESERFINDPWRGEALRRVAQDDPVIVIGTGLTMMDVALSLAEAGHRGTIDAVSRRGLLPQQHRQGNPGLARLPDPLFSRTFSSVRELLHELRTAAARAERAGGDWRDAVNALRSITPKLWEALNERERRRFLEHLLPFWNTHRHRAPPSVAEGIDRLIAEKRLRIHAARIRGAREVDDAIDLSLLPRGGEWPADRQTIRAAWVINCTGPTMNAAGSGNGLIERLLAAGAIRPGPLGMGLDASEAGRVIRRDGTVEERMFLVGPARIGSLWETTAVPELREQAAAVASCVLGVVQDKHAGEEPRVVDRPDALGARTP